MRMRAAACSVAIVVMIAVGRPAAQPRFTDAELSTHPYMLTHGDRPIAERIARHAALAVIAEKAGDLPRAARHLVVQCQMISQRTGDVTLSAPPCARARELAEAHDITDVKVGLKVAKAVIQVWTFNFSGGSATLNEAIKDGAVLNPDRPDGLPLISAHQLLGGAAVEMGQFDAARTHLTFAQEHCRNSGGASCAALADIFLCRLHTMLGDFESARTACDAGAVEAKVENDVTVLASLHWMRAFLEFNLGRPQQMLRELEQAWSAAQVDGANAIQPIIAQMMVDAHFMLGHLDEADRWQGEIDKALKAGKIPFFFGPQIAMRRGLLAAARLKMNEAETAFAAASRSLIQEMSIRALVAGSRVHRFRGNNTEARAWLERAIAKIENARTGVGGSTLRASYLAFHAGAYRELAGVEFAADGAAAGPKVLEVSEAGRARALIDALASAQAAGAAAPTLTAQQVQSMLRPEDVLVEYVSAEDRLSAVTVTRDRITIANLPGAALQSQLARRVDFFATLVQESDEAALKPSARRLYDDVLAPALKDVPATARTLIIAADGPLHALPFDAIGDPPVIDRWNVVMVPSASALATRTTRARPSQAALVVAAPASLPGLLPLTAAPIEADAVRSRIAGSVAELSGPLATESRLIAEGPEKFAVLHFASHALVDAERPLRSALILGVDAGKNDGRWSAEEIYRSKLRADLVVLSACSTAAGAQANGEGVMSLSRAFLFAGAGATIATLWDVPDAPGPVFADVLYRELATGQPLGVAAADARRELRRLGAPPRAWAAYVLTGNPATRVGISLRTPIRTLAAGITGGIAMVAMIAAIVVAIYRARFSRLRWAPLAAAGALLALVAVTLQFVLANYSYTNGSLASRGNVERGIAPFVAANRVVSWSPVTAADEHLVEIFNEAGVPMGSATAQAAPYTLPESHDAGWFRIAARKDGRTINRSALLRIPH